MLRPLLVLPLLAILLSGHARAQTVLWSDSFESGMSDWTSLIDNGGCGEQIYAGEPCVGDWQVIDGGNSCAAWAAPFPDGAKVAWFGIAGNCTYDGGNRTASNQALRKNTPVQLPASAGSLTLRFLSKSEGESDQDYDLRIVRVSANGGTSWTQIGRVWNSDWYEAAFDLSNWSGQSILLKFTFDTLDDSYNGFHGWYLDGIRIESSSETGTRFCAGDGTASPCPCGNFGAAGHGCATSFDVAGASLTASGSPQVSADSIALHATGVSNTVVTFFQGTTQSAFGLGAAFGDGLRCAGGVLIRLRAASASGNAADFPHAGDPGLSVAGSVPVAGGMRTYQVWFRNAAGFCTPSTFNLTNGLILTWVP